MLSRCLAVFGLFSAFCASAAATITAPILDVYGTSLTAHPPVGGSTLAVSPRFDQRGVDIDGTLRARAPLGWAVAGDPLGGGYSTGRRLGDVSLATGSYNPTDIDLALPTIGPPIVIGRTYNNLQQDGSGSRQDNWSQQGYNWFQVSQPQISLLPGASADLDVLYIYYGNDRFIELQRTGLTSNEFKAKNGAAGVATYTAPAGSDPELYTYYDQSGNQTVFFGFDNNAGNGTGQLWKMVDRAGNVAYVHSLTATTAVSNYSSGRMQSLFDASGRKYALTYSVLGLGTVQLTKVEAQLNIASVWTTIEQVEYDYYNSTDTDKGKSGDLRLVTITHKGVSGGDYVRRKYYRYYTRAWNNTDGRRGEAHSIKMVVGFDGVRQYDPTGTSFYSQTDATLLPYSESYFEYPSGDYRLANATFSGNCGCGGGTSGTYTFSYADASGYSMAIANTSYDTGWGRRTVIVQPDGTYVTQYFDETGAPLSRVMTDSDPAGSPTKTWVTGVDRDSNGLVTTIHSAANCTGYTHSSGSISYSSSVGLVTTYTRHSASSNLDGLRDDVKVKEGTSGSATTTSSVSFTERQLLVGSTGAISIPQVDSTSTYPDYSTAVTTGYSPVYWSSTNTSPEYLAVKTLTTTNPTVTSGNNGSNAATSNVRYLRKDGTTAFSMDEGGTLFYSGRTTFGQTATQIADFDGSTLTNIASEDKPGGVLAWSLSAGGSGTPVNATTTMTYDDQGRGLTWTRPSVNGTLTSASYYLLDGYRLGMIWFPRKVTSTYYGPAQYARINHAGKPDQRITFQFPGGTGSPAIPSTSDWSARVDTIYDPSGMRVTDLRTYTVNNATYDADSTFYDPMGRRARIIDKTGTITRSVFDERGMVVERWVGTNDNGWSDPAGSVSGPANMVKVEALEYDNGSGSGGGNGYLTTRAQSSDGAWGAGGYAGGDRCTTYTDDFRGRTIVQGNPAAPHTVTKYDNSNRVTAVAQYSSTSGLTISTDPSTASASSRVALNETYYDQRGQVYQTKGYNIAQAAGGGYSTGDKITSQPADNWYDETRRLRKTRATRTNQTFYDRLGRVTDRFDVGLAATTYSAAMTIPYETVYEQMHYALDPLTGKAIAQWLVQRAHDDGSQVDALDVNADNDPLKLSSTDLYLRARPQITAMWYDDWDRLTDTVSYGTNGGSTFNRSGLSCPSSSATTLKTTYAYDDFGRQTTVTDPAGVVSKTEYEFSGRRAATIDNYVNGNPQTTAGTNNDQDRRTDYAYTNGLVHTITREMPKTSTLHDNDQVTTYTYGSTLLHSQVASNSLLVGITYPDASSTGYTYNALSQTATATDPSGNVITTTYDAGGRTTSREATTIAGGFDNRVTRNETSYNSRGMVSDVLQKDGGGTTLDEVAFDYDGWGNLSSSTQDPDSAIGGGGRASYAMTWTYALDTTSNHSRPVYLSSWTQPDGTGPGMIFTTYYGGAKDQSVRRPVAIEDANSTSMVSYDYLGSATVVGTTIEEPANTPTNILCTNGDSTYYNTNMDRFNRPILYQWTADFYGVPFTDQAMTYDLVGNVTSATDGQLLDSGGTNAFDTITTYDSLRRPIERDEGKISGGTITGGNQKRQEITPRNLAGRITSDKIDLAWGDGNTTFDGGSISAPNAGEMDDSRTYNSMNRLTGRAYYDEVYTHAGSRHAVSQTYDANGNLTNDGEAYKYVYNPFGQLVQIKDQSNNLVAEYHYNGLGQRISEQTDTNDSGNTGTPDNTVDSHDPVFYIAVDPSGRRIATFRGSDTYPKETFVYHPDGYRGPAYQGGLIARDRDADLHTNPKHWASQAASSTRAERYYYCADSRGNVIALMDNTGTLVEQYRYTASGLPYGIPAGNTDATTAQVTASDATYVNALISGHTYEVRSDFNMDGVVDSGDLAVVTANTGASRGRGLLSIAAVHNATVSAKSEYFGSGLETIALGTLKDRNAGLSLGLEGVDATDPDSESGADDDNTASPRVSTHGECAGTWLNSQCDATPMADCLLSSCDPCRQAFMDAVAACCRRIRRNIPSGELLIRAPSCYAEGMKALAKCRTAPPSNPGITDDTCASCYYPMYIALTTGCVAACATALTNPFSATLCVICTLTGSGGMSSWQQMACSVCQAQGSCTASTRPCSAPSGPSGPLSPPTGPSTPPNMMYPGVERPCRP
jgi:YD repeat-containing protein